MRRSVWLTVWAAGTTPKGARGTQWLLRAPRKTKNLDLRSGRGFIQLTLCAQIEQPWILLRRPRRHASRFERADVTNREVAGRLRDTTRLCLRSCLPGIFNG